METDPKPEVPAAEPVQAQVRDLTDEEIMERAKQINEARELERQEELRRAEAVRKAEEERKAEEIRRAEEIHRAEEAQKAAKIAEAERLKRAEEEKKQEEIRRARELVREDDAKKAAAEKEAAKNQPKKKHIGLKIVLAIIIILIVIAGIGILSHGVITSDVAPGVTFPYQTSYNVWLPQGETSVAGLTFNAVGDDASVKFSIPGLSTQTVLKGQTVPPINHKLTLTLFWGAWKVMDINYSAELTYKGLTPENLLAFGAVIKTDRQIPEFLLDIGLSLSHIQYSKA